MNQGHSSRIEMAHEVTTAASFVSSLLKIKGCLIEHQLQVFQECLQDSMSAHYKHHWYPDRPWKGSAYRCIRINQRVTMDPLFAQAANQCGLTIKQLFSLLPLELTLWVDPFEVCYRIGEDGSFCTLYEAKATSPVASPVPLAELPYKATSSPVEPISIPLASPVLLTSSLVEAPSSPVASLVLLTSSLVEVPSSPVASPVLLTSSPVASPVLLADLPYDKNHFLMSGPSRPLMRPRPCYQIPMYRLMPCYPIPYRSC